MYTLNNYIVNANGIILNKNNNQPIKQFKSNKYLQCRVVDDDGQKHIVGVHTLVARYFCDDWFEGCVVHHIDGNTHNNISTNLTCLSRSEHSRQHADPSYLIAYVKENGPPNKGKKCLKSFVKSVVSVQSIDVVQNSIEVW